MTLYQDRFPRSLKMDFLCFRFCQECSNYQRCCCQMVWQDKQGPQIVNFSPRSFRRFLARPVIFLQVQWFVSPQGGSEGTSSPQI